MNQTPQETTDHEPPGPGDPRMGFAVVTQALHPLIAEASSQTDKSTPCPDFTVKELLEHVVLVMRRVAAIGRGEHWSSIIEEPVDGGWGDQFKEAAHATMEAWTDPAKLHETYEVPWGEIPGAPLMLTYTAELAVHGWDLATAIGADFAVDDEHLHGPLMAAQFIPAEGRGTDEMPFSEVVDPGKDAPVLLKIAGWMGRQVA